MLNYRIIAKALGGLLWLEALLLGLCLLVGQWYRETNTSVWLIPIGICALLGLLGLLGGRRAHNNFGRRDGYMIVSSVWIIYSLIGMIPFLIDGHTDRVAVAFFETMSGFTTTGATAFSDVDALPHSILFWRSLTHWIGGMGIIFFTLAVLPAMGIGEQKLFSAEATGLKMGKLHPRISTTAHWLWSVYFLITGSCILTYYLCGMSLFDAVNHGFATIATGGFSTHTESVAYFHSPAIEYATTFFMFLASTNFTLLYLFIIKRRFRQVLKDEELRLFFAIITLAVVIITITKWIEAGTISEQSFRNALFNAMSLMSTTGFTTDNFMLWPHLAWIILTAISVIGSCQGSTSGGVKVVRVLTSFKIVRNEFKRILHPRAVLPVRLNHDYLGNDVTQSIFAYTFFYIVLIALGTAAMTMMHLPILDAVGLSISAFSNIGPTIGHFVGPLDAWGIIPDTALWVNSFLMLAGRLEIFTLLLPFVPAFWRDN